MNEQQWHLKPRNNFQVRTENTFNFNLDITFESHKEIIWLKKTSGAAQRQKINLQ